MAETHKAEARRFREGWFDEYAPDYLSGIDIGWGGDPLNNTFRRWDKVDGDATVMAGVPGNVFHTVYASHVLEHLADPVTALRSWYRICRPGGNVIVCIPHRDLYEKRRSLPSNWNAEHKYFYLPDVEEKPDTLSLRAVIDEAIPGANVVSLRVLEKGFTDPGPDQHSGGEYSIEAIIRKPGLSIFDLIHNNKLHWNRGICLP